MLAMYRKLGLPLRGLAVQIRRNHRDELARIKSGEEAQWKGRYFRKSQEQLNYYQHLLVLEEDALSAILRGVRQAA